MGRQCGTVDDPVLHRRYLGRWSAFRPRSSVGLVVLDGVEVGRVAIGEGAGDRRRKARYHKCGKDQEFHDQISYQSQAAQPYSI